MANGEKRERGEKKMKEILYKLIVVLTLVPLVLAGLLMSAAPVAVAQGEGPGFGCPPPGCNGDIKVHDGNDEPSPITKDEPKVCSFHLHGFNFDPNTSVHWWIETQPGGTEVLSGDLAVNASGEGRTGLLNLPDGQYKVYWQEGECSIKHKVFKVECPPPTCVEVDTHYGEWTCGLWGTCLNGVQERTCTRDVWTTDKNDPSIECSRTTENKTETQWCNLCVEVDTHYGDWSAWSEWGECLNGEHSRTRTREVWTTDKYHPEHECSRTTETDTQTEDCDLCVVVDTHYGEWSTWSEWGECLNGEHSRTRTREVWTTDVNHPEHECSRTTETDTQTEDCDLCVVVDTHYGEWSEWSPWGECVNGERSQTRTREVWTTDVNHPEHECDRWTETDTQTENCDLCVVVDTHYGEWSAWSEWSDCDNGFKTHTRTREVWTTDVNHPEHECDRWTETDRETESCLPGVCEVVDTHGTRSCGGWSDCVDGTQWQECTVDTWTTDHYRPDVVCGRESSITTEQRPCEVPEDRTPAGQVELVFSCPVLEAYDPVNWNFGNNTPTGDSLYDVPGPSAPDQTKIHPRGGYWKYAESVYTMLAAGRLDPYGEYWTLLACWDVNKGWWPVGLVRPMYLEEDVYPTYPILWWVEDWANPAKTPNSFDEVWYQVIRPQDFGLVGLK